MDEINIGQYSAAVILSIILGIAFKLAGESMTDRLKIVITICIGLAFGFVLFLYQEAAWTAKAIITYLVNGFAAAAIASGLYSYTKSRK